MTVYPKETGWQRKLAGFFLRGRKMNDCPRHYTQKKAAYRKMNKYLCGVNALIIY